MKPGNVIQIPRRFVKSEWGGTETVILETGKRMPEFGFNTEIICPNALAGSNREIVSGIKIKREPYFYPYWGLSGESKKMLDKKGGNIFSFSLMKTLMRHQSVDLIHLHTGKRIGGIGRFAARAKKIPYIVSLHGGVLDVPDEEVRTWTQPSKGTFEWGKLLGWLVGSRRVLDDADALICVNKAEQEQFQKLFPKKKVVYLPNGVDIERFKNGDGGSFRKRYNIPGNNKILLNVGRIDPQKNQMFLVRMLSEILKRESKFHLVMIGPSTNADYYELLLKTVKKLKLSQNVTLINGLEHDNPELIDAYHAADLFILPSIHEPFGIVILEAWAAGLPVIASRVGGVPSFVTHKSDGVLFISNDENDFLRQFWDLNSNPRLLKELGLRGRENAVNNYSWETITKRLLKLYEETINENTLRK